MKLIGYVRVSTGTQAEDGLGLEIQEAAIRNWAKKHGHAVVSISVDAGISGTKELDGRQGLANAFELLKSGDAAGLVVYRLDRLARDLVPQEHLLSELRRLRAEVFTTSDAEAGYLADDPDDPSRKLIRQILGAISDYERGLIALRLRGGRERKRANGGYAYGAPPLGYRAQDGALVPDTEEQGAVRRIKELRSSGESLRGIARHLEREGYRPKRGSRWHPETLRLILGRDQANAHSR